jgi:hypothetical protein
MKYKVCYYEDEFTCVAETEIECEEDEIHKKTDEYFEKNLQHLDIAGAKWFELP